MQHSVEVGASLYGCSLTFRLPSLRSLGLSNIDHAILLCALHHLLLHNRHWKILLRGGQYWLQPAVEIDLEQTLIALPSKNPLMQQPLVDSPQ